MLCGIRWGYFIIIIFIISFLQRNSSSKNENLLKVFSPSGNPRCRWVCFFIRTDLEKCSITSLAHQWILWSEWVPSEWESKQLIKHCYNPQITHMTPVNHLMSCKAKTCMFVRNKSSRVDYLWIIVMFLSDVWTLILMAPIHCRGSTAEQVMHC